MPPIEQILLLVKVIFVVSKLGILCLIKFDLFLERMCGKRTAYLNLFKLLDEKSLSSFDVLWATKLTSLSVLNYACCSSSFITITLGDFGLLIY